MAPVVTSAGRARGAGGTAANSESAMAARTWRSVTAWADSLKAASSALSARMLMRRVRPPDARASRLAARAANRSGPR